MIVFDASPLILLAKTELIESFLEGFPEPVAIPAAVELECCGKKDSFDAKLLAALIRQRRIEVRRLKHRRAVDDLQREFKLGLGEAQALALAQASHATLVVMEDRNGVNACKLLKHPFTGVLGIVRRMTEKRLLSTEEALRKLELLRTFGRYRSDIIEDVVRRLEETR